MMSRNLLLLFLLTAFTACTNRDFKEVDDGKRLQSLIDDYYEKRLALFPIESTQNGETRYNDTLIADFTDSHRLKVRSFYLATLDSLGTIDRKGLNENDKINYDYLHEYLNILLMEFDFKFNYIPTDQMWGTHLQIGQFASGTGAQPFKTIADYRNWLKRIDAFDIWIDSAIVYFRKGMAEGITLPKPLVQKMIPQFRAMVTSRPEDNLYYSPVNLFPESFTAEQKSELSAAYIDAVNSKVIPMNQRMADFLENEYLPAARTTSGYGAMPGGAEYYLVKVKLNTTTDKTPDEIYQTGLKEVARIREEMESVKELTGFKGDLNAFFNYVRTDSKFFPFSTEKEILDFYYSIHEKLKPQLNKLFGFEPKTPFEIRQTEAFRAATASAQYVASPDNVKAGIFYVPILNPREFNVTGGMESLFLHEAIPGHHYQISLQRENQSLPAMRKFDPFSNAYIEGWALYCESLGKELGLYTDPYQYLGALSDEMHRAVRLVVDVALHTGTMTREEAIAYMLENEPITEQYATMEIERYMSGPGQALGYKIGSIKIRELRTKYEKMLGDKFRINDFHFELLKDGSMPLTVLEQKMDRWAAGNNQSGANQ